jgi:hypothetical protein
VGELTGLQAGLLAQLRGGELACRPARAARPAALRELPLASAHRVTELLDQPKTAALLRHHHHEVGLVDDRVGADRAVREADAVLAHGQPGAAVDLAGGELDDSRVGVVHAFSLPQR